MPLILGIETATRVCSVALFRDHEILAIRESEIPNIHSSKLTVFMEEIGEETGISFRYLDAVAVSMGPGSYTGLRIGVASAKGLCYALDKPLIAIPTLESMSYGISRQLVTRALAGQSPVTNVSRLICPMIDARRMEVYCGIYDHENREVREVKAEVISENSFSEYLEHHHVIFAGDGASKCRELFANNPNAHFLDDFEASARYLVSPALEKYRGQSFENQAYFEPFYLKDFVAGKPHVKGLR